MESEEPQSGCARQIALGGSWVCMAPTFVACWLFLLVAVAQFLGWEKVAEGKGDQVLSGLFVMALYGAVGFVGATGLAAIGLVLHSAGLGLAVRARRLGSSAGGVFLGVAHAVMLSVDVVYLGFLSLGAARLAWGLATS